MAGRSDEVAYAANWRSVLLVDAVLGLLGVLAGIGVAVRGNGVIGSLLVGAGLGYLFLTARRYVRWKALRATPRPPQG
jgi:hypothetical protein